MERRSLALAGVATISALLGVPLATAGTLVAFDNTNDGNSTTNPISHGGYDMVGGGATGNNIEQGQLFTLNNSFTSGDLSSVSIWASTATTAETFTLSVYSVITSGTSMGRPAATALETLTGTTPATPAGGPPFDFITLTPSGPEAVVNGGATYWFVVTEAPPAGYWGSEANATATSTAGFDNTTYNHLFTTAGTSGVTYADTAGLLQESALVDVSTVPVPASLPLLMFGVAGISLLAARRKVLTG